VPRRICIFVHFDATNLIAPCVEYYLSGLKEVCDEVAVVSNCDLPLAEKDKLLPLVSSVFLRENSGMDFGAWKDAINQIGWSHISKFDELILANDSCYAPMFPFSEMFTAMSERGDDFWGVTEHPAARTRSGQLEAHLQSYFLVFTNKVVLSESFRHFWQGVSVEKEDYNTVIRNSEAQITATLNEAGFKYSAYLRDADFAGSDIGGNWNDPLYFNRTIWSWKNLLQHRSPFLKRRAIPFHLERVSRLVRSGYGNKVTRAVYTQTFFWRDCIESSKSSYPIEIVNQELLSKQGTSPKLSSMSSQKMLFHACGPLRVLRKIRRSIKAKVSN